MSDNQPKRPTDFDQGNLEESYAVSPLQHGMLFHNLFESASGVDIEQLVCTFRERLDPNVLKRAWQMMVDGNPIMRSAFAWEERPEPIQNVYRKVEIPFEVRDLGGLTSEEQYTELENYLRDDRERGFDLTLAPLIRIRIFETGAKGQWLVWTFHHALLDGRSYRMVLEEVLSIYEEVVAGREPKLKVRRPYKDYISWSEEQDPGKAESFWRTRLGDFESPTPLPFGRDADPNPQAAVRRAQYEKRLPFSVTESLRTLLSSYDLTLNTAIQTAWGLLLGYYNSEEDVVFGTTRACRHSSLDGLDTMLGLFINTIPMRLNVSRDRLVLDLLRDVRRQHLELRDYENTPLVKIQEWAGTGPGLPLFESIIVFDNAGLNASMRALGGKWEDCEFRAIEQTNYPLTLFAYGESELQLRVVYDGSRFSEASIIRMVDHLERLLTEIADRPGQPIRNLRLLTEAEEAQMLVEWNDTGASYEKDACIHHLFEAQAALTPDEVALAFADRELTYYEVNRKADQLAAALIDIGIGPNRLAGICVGRSPEMVIGMLAVLKAGGGYVPLDPDYPEGRLEFMIRDSELRVLLTDRETQERFRDSNPPAINLDEFWTVRSDSDVPALNSPVTSKDLAYVIYTSGSTGVPKGVMVEHGNVVNFFRAIDEEFGTDPGVWLAVTSISFDISVMELLWTLSRGFKVVIQGGSSVETYKTSTRKLDKPIDFSLFYFANAQDGNSEDSYRLLLEGAKFADAHNFAAVWTPERHFHPFGGLYPNPSVTGAAIAAVTSNVRIRAGSVVLPLHDPVRVAEEWAVVDNLSKGRVDIAFATGWHASDFSLKPESYPNRYEVMREGVETVRSLWLGEPITRVSGDGSEVRINVYPKPVQEEIPIWFTAAGNPESFRGAGEAGVNLLTNLLGQSVEDLADKIRIYREAREVFGHGANSGKVTLMLHTFVGEGLDAVREKVRKPFTDYLKTSVNLIRNAPWSYPAFEEDSRKKALERKETLGEALPDADFDTLAAHAFERYFETSGLFGTPETCIGLVESLKAIGVDEIACLIDFNVDADSVLAGLEHLDRLRKMSNDSAPDDSIGGQIRRHQVTHMQCTPSAARLMVADQDTREALGQLRHLALGGEELPPSLLRDLPRANGPAIHNMYGPTETTIWSTSHTLTGFEATVPIGRPLANTQVYILNEALQPVPVGVPGELHIGGDGVTRGYLNRVELTAEKFIKNIFDGGGSSRLYKTGDLAAFRPDGTIEFLGRLDHQVKVRGYRVELGEIQAVLEEYPGVKESVVVARDDSLEGKTLVGYVVPRNISNKNAVEQVENWKSVWEETYGHQGDHSISTRDFTGWKSSYDGSPIPEVEMNEWLEGTVAKIRALKPSRVLEIGCGTGLILFEIAPGCEEYTATDNSGTALELVKKKIEVLDAGLPQVDLLNRSAHDLSDLPAGHYDTVLLNSVAQYFPDAEYMLRVLRRMIRTVKPGGSIFVGDVRSFPLLNAFHASVEMRRASASDSCALLAERIRERVSREQELAFAPEFFERLPETLKEITGVEISLKKGRHHNELTKFRYDVTLRIGQDERKTVRPEVVHWDERPVAFEELRDIVRRIDDGVVAISGIKNKRLQSEFRIIDLLSGRDVPRTVGELRESIAACDSSGMEPDEVWEMFDGSKLAVNVRWSASGPDRFDVLICRKETHENLKIEIPSTGSTELRDSEFTNRPEKALYPDVATELRMHLTAKLPPHMVPSSFVILDEIPLTPNGKIDRAALPAPSSDRVSFEAEGDLPASDLEEVVADLWGEMLGIENVGSKQSFFHIGGHSLLATQLVTRLRGVFQVDLTLRDVFDFPTVSGIAGRLIDLETKPGQTEKIAQIMKKVATMEVPNENRASERNG